MLSGESTMLRAISVSIALLMLLASPAWSLTYTGSITSADGTFFASLPWSSGSSLSWSVDDTTNDGYWSYFYNFSSDIKEVSHVILEVSDTFTKANIFKATGMDEGGLDIYSPNNSNPGLPGDIYGIKWNVPDAADGTDWDFFIVTDRKPMWGDFYAKDGTYGEAPNKTFVYGYNSMFGNDTTATIADGNAGGWVLVPDTVGSEPPLPPLEQVPEPGTIALVGLGLAAIGLYRRGRRN
jgi:hypothetical protein